MDAIRDLIDAHLSKEEQFALWMLEYYRATKGISGVELKDLIEKHNLINVAVDNYTFWHIEAVENAVGAIDGLVGV